jgi:hypothetical protein
MNARSIRLLGGSFLLVLAIALYFIGCKWGTENNPADPPLITLRQYVIADEKLAEQYHIAEQKFYKTDAEMKALLGGKELWQVSLAEQAQWHTLYQQLLAWQQSMARDNAEPVAYWKFGIYARDDRNTGLILGVVVPAIFFAGSVFMLVWGLSAKTEKGH